MDLYAYDAKSNRYLVIEVKSSETGRFPKLKTDPETFLRTRAEKAARARGFWRPESTPVGIKDTGRQIGKNLQKGASVSGIKMEVALPKQGSSGTPEISFRQWQ